MVRFNTSDLIIMNYYFSLEYKMKIYEDWGNEVRVNEKIEHFIGKDILLIYELMRNGFVKTDMKISNELMM